MYFSATSHERPDFRGRRPSDHYQKPRARRDAARRRKRTRAADMARDTVHLRCLTVTLHLRSHRNMQLCIIDWYWCEDKSQFKWDSEQVFEMATPKGRYWFAHLYARLLHRWWAPNGDAYKLMCACWKITRGKLTFCICYGSLFWHLVFRWCFCFFGSCS